MTPEAHAIAEDASGHPELKASYRYYVLAILIVVYTFNFVDRQILGILKDSIQKELALTDTQVGLMGGLAFAALYSTLGLPIAWLADRKSRTWIMTIALTVWSAFTAACGAASSFWGLFAMRMGVGVGEAGGVAPAYSLISDYFPPNQRARALAVYSFGIPIGMSLGILAGGLIAAEVGWRTAFVVVGLVGLVLAPVFKLTVKDPVRGGFDSAGGAHAKPAAAPFREVARTLLPKPSFWLLALGAASSSVCGYGVAFWLPTYLQRTHGLTLVETSWYYGVLTLVGGVLGIWLGGALADRYGRKSKRAYALVPAACFLVALPAFLLALSTDSLTLALLLILIPTGLNLAWLGPVIAAVQHLAPAHMRSTASAMFLLINNLVGIALGTYYFGWMSDLLKPSFGADSMRWAIYSGGAFYFIAAILLVSASKKLDRDWVGALVPSGRHR